MLSFFVLFVRSELTGFSHKEKRMVVSESEIGEVESPLQGANQQQKNHPFSELGRQSSIYSLTLDEFQHTLCDGGKNFGSMNMDEFLTSIWNAEENQAINSNNNNTNHQINYFLHRCAGRRSMKFGLRYKEGSKDKGRVTIATYKMLMRMPVLGGSRLLVR